NIGDGAFARCASLIAITVDAVNPAYTSVDGVLFNKGQTTLLQYPAGKVGSYVIPGSVANIGNFAISGCTGLTSIALPHHVNDIGYGAFSGSTSLISLVIPDSVTNIQGFAFQSCANLKG